jgi:hypothetical protein
MRSWRGRRTNKAGGERRGASKPGTASAFRSAAEETGSCPRFAQSRSASATVVNYAMYPVTVVPVRAKLIEPVRPIPQRLTVHAADPCSFRPAHPVQNRRDRQQPAALVRVLARRRQTAKLSGRMARLDLDNLRHGACPPRILNHAKISLDTLVESAQRAVGIIRLHAEMHRIDQGCGYTVTFAPTIERTRSTARVGTNIAFTKSKNFQFGIGSYTRAKSDRFCGILSTMSSRLQN